MKKIFFYQNIPSIISGPQVVVGKACVVRQVTGRTVIDYINQMLLMEAAFLLQTTQLSISQIADRLHFADTPSFSKFFLRHNGMSPKEYRKG